ncbi:MAG: TolC family protein [Candidatus Marinimicrobia bacterium]|nr:TolC family protein [Candidatus Neomarinimicrobiota bacterium]
MKKIQSILILLIIFTIAYSQESFDRHLNQILQNNPELKAVEQKGQSSIYNSKDKLLPLDPDLEYKFKENDNYEAGITQKLKFPSYYFLQYRAYKLTKEQQQLVQDAFVVKLLEEAAIKFNWLIYLDKQIEIQEDRMQRADSLNKLFKQQLQQGEISQLPFNRSKLHLLEYKTSLKDLREKRKEVLQNLIKLNGGQKLEFNLENYQPVLSFPKFNDYKEKYCKRDPEIKLAQLNSDLSSKNLQIAKHQWLPDFKIGVHTDKMKNANMHFGISIPLWKERNRVKQAKVDLNSQEYNEKNIITTRESELKNLYSEYKKCKHQYFEYKNILNKDRTLELLEKSFESGEISAINYYQEIEKLYQYQDKLRQLRRDIAILEVILENYKLLDLKSSQN